MRRWVRSPDCAAADMAQGLLDHVHYVAMYWFADPHSSAAESAYAW